MFRFLALLAILACGVLSFLSWVMPYLVGWYISGISAKVSFGNFESVCSGSDCSASYQSTSLSDWKKTDKDVYDGLCANIAMTLIALILLVAALFLLFKKSGITHLVFVTGGIFVFIAIMAFVGKFQNSNYHTMLKDAHNADSSFHWSYSASTAFSIIAFIISLPGAFFAMKAKDD
ncbi:hypothetical protein M0811_02899 [Anaeramoeba ignava]|uniref:Uncharacterized protein n=1 Tax=Anaeramoeba ignava TaxID=1746090 RepID=A0A9Q0R6F5_ANAIG|nr:hypothetical protein M0811_02899 [Anaeramoeba ignava]